MDSMVYEGRTSLVKYWYLIGIGTVLFLSGTQLINSPGTGNGGYFFAFPGLFFVGLAYFLVRATGYTVTSRQVTEKKGLLSSRTSEVEISDIRHVQVHQNGRERLLGIGDVVISTAGGTGTEIVFSGIQRPYEVADLIPGRRERSTQRGVVVPFTKR